jgi:hypothetical protein
VPFISECENDPSEGDLLFLSLCHLITAAKDCMRTYNLPACCMRLLRAVSCRTCSAKLVFYGFSYSLSNAAIAEGSNMPLPGEFILVVRDGAQIQPMLDVRP